MKKFATYGIILVSGLLFLNCKDKTESDIKTNKNSRTLSEASPSISSNLDCSGAQESIPSGLKKAGDDNQKVANFITKKVLCVSNKAQATQVINEFAAMKPEAVGSNYVAKITYYAARILRPLEGVAWRMRPILEGHSDMLHMMAIRYLRNIKYNDYLYGQHLRAMFDYLADPPRPAQRSPQFHSVTQLQDYIQTTYLSNNGKPGSVDAIVTELRKMKDNEDQYYAFNLDRNLITGVGAVRFIDRSKLVRKYVKPYHYDLLFLAERFAGGLYYFVSLELDDFSNIVRSLIINTGLNNLRSTLRLSDNRILGGFINKIRRIETERSSLPQSVTPQLVYQTIAKKYPNFLKERTKLGAKTVDANLSLSHKYFKAAALHQLNAYVCSILLPHGKSPKNYEQGCRDLPSSLAKEWEMHPIARGHEFIFNPNLLSIDYPTKHATFYERMKIYEADDQYYSFESMVTGVTLSLKVKRLFQFDRSKFKGNRIDLKAYFPRANAFDTNRGSMDGNTWKWNHDFGRPLQWNDPTFNGFIKNAPNGREFYDRVLATFRYTPSIAPFALAFITAP